MGGTNYKTQGEIDGCCSLHTRTRARTHTQAPLACCVCAVFFTVYGHNPAQFCPTFAFSSMAYKIRFVSNSLAVIGYEGVNWC
jgi:hypothetical protein